MKRGSKVRVLPTPYTEAIGIVGLRGEVHDVSNASGIQRPYRVVVWAPEAGGWIGPYWLARDEVEEADG